MPVLVTPGTAVCSYDAGTTDIELSAPTIIHWNSFKVPRGGRTEFRFVPGVGNPSVLNRVTGRSQSLIEGSLGSNGQVLLINPFFTTQITKTGNISADGGFFASTLDTEDDTALLSGGGAVSFAPRRRRAPQIIVQGTVRSVGGDVVLLAGSLDNTGSIEAGGSVHIGVGDGIDYSPLGAERIVRNRSAAPVQNLGTIRARSIEIAASEITNRGGLFSQSQVFLKTDGGTVFDEQGEIMGELIVNGEIVTRGAIIVPDESDIPTGRTPTVSRFPALRAPGSATATTAIVRFQNAAIVGLANSAAPRREKTATPATIGKSPRPKIPSKPSGIASAAGAGTWMRKSNFFGVRGGQRRIPAQKKP